MSSFVHLHVHSHYSLLDGLSRIDELVAAAKADGQPALALTDHGVMYGAIEFSQAARKAGVQPIIGIEAYVAPRSRFDREKQVGERAYSHLVLLAKDRIGYQNLLQLTTKAHLEGFYYKPRIDWELLDTYGDGLIALSGCMGGEIPLAIREGREDDAIAALQRFRDRFGDDFYLEMQRRSDVPELTAINAKLVAYAKRYAVPIVATNDVHYLTADDAEAQDILLCLQTKSKQSDRGRLTMLGENYSLRTAREMALLFEDMPDAIERTIEIANKCSLELELGKILLPTYALPSGDTYETYLRKRCEEGLERRYGRVDHANSKLPTPDSQLPDPGTIARARERMDYELSVIEKMGLSSYFCIVADFVNWAKRQGIVVGPGRGSAAGSIVAYLTNITNLDPLAYDLLFERFLAPGRVQMPDIDLDFADHRRDEVLAYVRAKYGEDHVAQIITFGTMAARASVRDAGRVLDIPLQFCDRLAKLIPMQDSLDDAVAEVPELRELIAADPTTERLFAIAKRLEGVARHTSTHACGVVISGEPLVRHTPIQRASADDATIVTQYEMHAIEVLGLLKMDFLGLSNLSIIERTVNMIRASGGTMDIDRLPLDDAPTYALLQRGETTGCFQVESGGMKRYLKELQPTEFEDIIAMVSLYRPGPMELIPEYIARKFGRKPVTYLHPKLEPILKNTYGILVYQEQLMRLARDLAGFTLSEADVLRKAVGKKMKSLLDEQRDKLINGMITNGIHQKIARNIWEWIEPFARYGFNRSHGACYALIAYQTAYLKAHYPAEFMAALLTAERGSTERLTVLIQECREMGIPVLGPDVNDSEALFTVVNEANSRKPIAESRQGVATPAAIGYRLSAIRFGLAAIKNVGEHLVEALIAERRAHGAFCDLADLLNRIQDKDFNKKSLECLIRAGCFDRFGERGRLLANVDALLGYHRAVVEDRVRGQENLFGTPGGRAALQLAPADPAPQRLVLGWEKELLGLYYSAHPFTAVRAPLRPHIATVADVKHRGGQGITCGGIITRVKRITTKNGEPMLFAELEDETGSVEVVVFPRILAVTPQVWIAETPVLVRGNLSEKDGTPKVLADYAVQVVAGQEHDAIHALGGSGSLGSGAGNSGSHPSGARIILDLPPGLPPERLLDLRTRLSGIPGSDPVYLRTPNGKVVSTGLRVSLTPELRVDLANVLGPGAVREEHDRVPT